MFLFLSKLLPLFLYPLGFACLLMVIALGLIWKKPRWAAGCLGVALVILLVSSSEWTAQKLTHSLEFQNIVVNALPTADAIVVLGGATSPQSPPRPWVDLHHESDRIFYGAQLFREGKAPKIILSGGRMDWANKDDSSSESADMVKVLEFVGIPATALIQEPTSLNTRQNAVNVKQIMDAQGMKRILLVTSAFHMPRSLAIFKKLGIDAIAAPTDFRTLYPRASISAESALLSTLPTAEHLANTSKALKEYVGLVIYWLRGWV
jgi:uncharacterized SAM-binding protein YcdF (DUF218 family)